RDRSARQNRRGCVAVDGETDSPAPAALQPPIDVIAPPTPAEAARDRTSAVGRTTAYARGRDVWRPATCSTANRAGPAQSCRARRCPGRWPTAARIGPALRAINAAR